MVRTITFTSLGSANPHLLQPVFTAGPDNALKSEIIQHLRSNFRSLQTADLDVTVEGSYGKVWKAGHTFGTFFVDEQNA